MKSKLLTLALVSATLPLLPSCSTPPPPPPPVTVFEAPEEEAPTPRPTPRPSRPNKAPAGGYSGAAEGFQPVERPSSYSN